MNNGREFGKSICDIYPKELELRAEYQADMISLLLRAMHF